MVVGRCLHLIDGEIMASGHPAKLRLGQLVSAASCLIDQACF